MDESNVLDSSFHERMNTLLANGEVPGLFEGDEYSALMTQCKEGAQRFVAFTFVCYGLFVCLCEYGKHRAYCAGEVVVE